MAKVRPNAKTHRATFIREWRTARNLTLERLAERVGVTVGALSQLERGIVSYTQPMLEALADALMCEPADLISRPPDARNGVELVWSQIPVEDRPRALDVLRAFTRKA